jgi:leucyl aminopeptidase (aminopeptidase T)
MRSMEMARAAYKAVHYCARLKPGENVLVLADSIVDRGLVDAFANAAYALGGQTQVMTFETKAEINREPPRAVAAAMAASDLVLDLIQQYIIHTDAYKAVREGGTRILCGTGITEDMLIRMVGGVDYDELLRVGDRLMAVFSAGAECRVETGDGDALTMTLTGRPQVMRDGLLDGPGDLDYMPGAQLSSAPIEESFNGSIVIDGSAYPPVGAVGAPIRVTYKDGRVVDVQGGPSGARWRDWLAKFNDPKMFYVAHISIGMNPAASLTGNILEDERVAGCFVLGHGSQMPHFKGALGKASSHSDLVAVRPRILVDGKVVAENGQFHV